MIKVQIVPRDTQDPHQLIRNAIGDGQVEAFELAKVKGGLVIRRTEGGGRIWLDRAPGLLVATLRRKDRSKEAELLQAFVGMLAGRFRSSIAAINLQFQNS